MSREHIPFRIEGFPVRVRPAAMAACVRERGGKARGPAGRPARMRVGR